MSPNTTRLSDAKARVCHNRVSVPRELTGFLGRSITYSGTDARTNELCHVSLSRYKRRPETKEQLAEVKEVVPELAD